MKKILIVLFVIIIAFGFNLTAYAHPGNTDKKGCHTCKTNCKKWGLKYGQYHCHRKK